MTRLRVATWNAEGMFVEGTKTRRATSHDAITALRRLNADIVFVPEFGDMSRLNQPTITAIRSLGYESHIVPYGEERVSHLGLGFFSRLVITKHSIHHLPVTQRALFEAYCRTEDKKTIRIIGVHLDDRSEKIRLKQIEFIVEIIQKDRNTPLIVMGDFNAMHSKTLFAKMTSTKVASVMAKRIPNDHVSSVAQRVHEMASGSTIDYIISHTSLTNLDPKLSATISAKQSGMEWAPKLRLAKIDWIFGSDDITTLSHTVKHDVGSDHRQVVADIML